jgi:hypothetical protein
MIPISIVLQNLMNHARCQNRQVSHLTLPSWMYRELLNELRYLGEYRDSSPDGLKGFMGVGISSGNNALLVEYAP